MVLFGLGAATDIFLANILICDHCAYVTSDGSLYMWGYNSYGQLGDGTKEPCVEPKKMMGDVISVSIDVDHTVALKKDGSVWEWKHVNKEFDKPRVPIKVMDGAIYVSAGAYHCAAIKVDKFTHSGLLRCISKG